MKDADKAIAAALAKSLVALCVRNTFLEDLHAGTTPSSKEGDYSDVKVVTPYGEIPWRNLSRIRDEEMKRLMTEIVNKIYTFLCRQNEAEFLEAFLRLGEMYTTRWDEPLIEEGFVQPASRAYHAEQRRKRVQRGQEEVRRQREEQDGHGDGQ
jgi:hypothetical protein